MQVSTLLRGCMVATLTAVSTLSFAQKVVTTEKTGQLETLIKESERENTPSLKVVGPINGEDIKIIRIMCGRDFSGYESEGTTRTLDLSEAQIKQEAGKNYFNEHVGFCRQRNRGEDVLSLRAAPRDHPPQDDDRDCRPSVRPMHLAC